MTDSPRIMYSAPDPGLDHRLGTLNNSLRTFTESRPLTEKRIREIIQEELQRHEEPEPEPQIFLDTSTGSGKIVGEQLHKLLEELCDIPTPPFDDEKKATLISILSIALEEVEEGTQWKVREE